MTKRTYSSDVEQFSAWNQQLRSLLRENTEPLSQPPTEDDSDDRDNKRITDIKKYAGSIGNDLFSLIMFDYRESDFVGERNKTIETTLQGLDDSVVDKFLSANSTIDSDNKTVSVLIYNEAQDVFFVFEAGQTGAGFQPSLEELKSEGFVNPDQTGTLQDILSAGKKYTRMLNKYDWRAGEPPEDEAVFDALSALLSAIHAPDMPAAKGSTPDHMLSPEQRAENEERIARIEKRRQDPEYIKQQQERIAKYLEKQKQQGAGREKR